MQALDTIASYSVGQINELIEWFSNVSPQLWAILVRGEFISGLCIVGGWIVALLLFILFMSLYFKLEYEKEEGPFGVLAVACAIGLTIGLAIVIFEGLPHMLAPEYEAIRFIISRGRS